MDFIEIKGYKSIKYARVEFSPINILIGANGSGKSNFITFFDFLNRLYNKNLSEYIELTGGVDKILHNGKKNTDDISFRIEFNNNENGYSATLKSGTDGFVFTNERLHYQGDDGKDISRSSREARIKSTENYRAKYVIKYLNGFRKYQFHDTSKNSAFTKTSHLENDSYYFYSDGSNLAAFIYNIHEKNRIVYNRIIKTIQSIAPFFLDFYLEPNSNNQIRIQWKDKFSDNIYGATDFSDGTIRFISLTVLFMQPELPDTIIIDEPELGLHPTAIAKLSGMIKSAAKKGCQVICATQSTDLLSHFSPEDIITVDQINGESKFNRLRSEELNEWLFDYTIGDLWKQHIVTGGQLN